MSPSHQQSTNSPEMMSPRQPLQGCLCPPFRKSCLSVCLPWRGNSRYKSRYLDHLPTHLLKQVKLATGSETACSLKTQQTPPSPPNSPSPPPPQKNQKKVKSTIQFFPLFFSSLFPLGAKKFPYRDRGRDRDRETVPFSPLFSP